MWTCTISTPVLGEQQLSHPSPVPGIMLVFPKISLLVRIGRQVVELPRRPPAVGDQFPVLGDHYLVANDRFDFRMGDRHAFDQHRIAVCVGSTGEYRYE